MTDELYFVLCQLRVGKEVDKSIYLAAYEQAGVDNLRFKNHLTDAGLEQLSKEEEKRKRVG